MKRLFEKIKLLNTSQSIIIGAIIISITIIISNNTYKISSLFCNEECKLEELKKTKSCARYTRRNTGPAATSLIKNDIYKKCLATEN